METAREAREEAEDGPEVTALLRLVENGDDAARGRLFELLYSELYRRAERRMSAQPSGHSLQATALVHEVYLRFISQSAGPWKDRQHFLLAAARAMANLLIDHARLRKRRPPAEGGESALDAVVTSYEERSYDLDELGIALEELAAMDPTMARAVDLRFFAGLSMEATAELLGLSLRTFQRRWKTTRGWLNGKIR